MTDTDPQTATVENWTPEQLKTAFDAGEVAIIDLRTPQEFSFEHIHGALLAPLATFEPRHLPAQEGKRLVFHCGSGVRSRKVAEACLAAGMRPVAHLDGGFAAWKTAKMPYVTIDPATGGMKPVTPGG
jgi:rhodanese-related sulfurtransferase